MNLNLDIPRTLLFARKKSRGLSGRFFALIYQPPQKRTLFFLERQYARDERIPIAERTVQFFLNFPPLLFGCEIAMDGREFFSHNVIAAHALAKTPEQEPLSPETPLRRLPLPNYTGSHRYCLGHQFGRKNTREQAVKQIIDAFYSTSFDANPVNWPEFRRWQEADSWEQAEFPVVKQLFDIVPNEVEDYQTSIPDLYDENKCVKVEEFEYRFFGSVEEASFPVLRPSEEISLEIAQSRAQFYQAGYDKLQRVRRVRKYIKNSDQEFVLQFQERYIYNGSDRLSVAFIAENEPLVLRD